MFPRVSDNGFGDDPDSCKLIFCTYFFIVNFIVLHTNGNNKWWFPKKYTLTLYMYLSWILWNSWPEVQMKTVFTLLLTRKSWNHARHQKKSGTSLPVEKIAVNWQRKQKGKIAQWMKNNLSTTVSLTPSEINS